MGKLRALAVPHPLRVAGTPVAYRFDRDTGLFTFRYRTAKAGRRHAHFGPGSRTTVAVPHVQYVRGYRVRVSGARVVSAAQAATLVLALRSGARVVTVRVAPSRRP